MKLYRFTIQAMMFAMALTFGMQGTFAYAPHTTHAGLTQEMIAFYETLVGERFTEEERELIIQASIDEDYPSGRALNHFYDPIFNRGINDYRTSYRWAIDELSGNDFTWGAGIDAWAKGDRRAALIVLGHLLHLVEDSAVPDHTRNDPHMGHGAMGLWTGASPLEDWADRAKTRQTLRGYGAELARKDPWNDPYAFELLCYDLKECFDHIATYSNGNFFSEDSILDTPYLEPIVLSSDGRYAFGRDELRGTLEKLYTFRREGSNDVLTLFTKNDTSVLTSYFDRLAPEAIATGARVIDLFLTHAETAKKIAEERQRKEHEQAVSAQLGIHERLANAGPWKQFTFGFSELFIRTPTKFIGRVAGATARSAQGGMRAYTVAFGEVVHTGTLTTESIRRGTPYAAQMAKEKYVEKSTEAGELAAKGVGYVVVGAQGSAEQLGELARQLTLALEALEGIRLARVNLPNNGEVLGAYTHDGGAEKADVYQQNEQQQEAAHIYHTGSSMMGGADHPANVIILGVAAGSAPLPGLSPPPPPAAEEDDLVTEDTVRPLAPTVISVNGIPLADCHCESLALAAGNVAISGSTEASSTVALFWENGTVDYTLLFATGEDGGWYYNITLPEGTTTLTLTATDAAQNISSPTTLAIAVNPPAVPAETADAPRQPGPLELVINEFAPLGTTFDTDDEWIELYNTTDVPLQLDGMLLCIGAMMATDTDAAAGPCDASRVALNGVLPPRGYYLVAREREDGTSALTEPTPHLIAPFTIPDDGAAITLIVADDDTIIDMLPYCAGWCGKAESGVAMERWRSDRPTEDYGGNWGPPLPEFARGLDRARDIVLGTPGERNSLNYLLALTGTIDADLFIRHEPGGYLVNGNRITLAAGKTLTFAPGVTVKFRPGQTSFFERSLLQFYGPLIAEGTQDAPIVFTTTEDDRAGGDLMRDGAPEDYATLAHAGGLDFFDGSEGTVLRHVEFRLLQSGPYFDRTSATMTSVTISDSLDGLELFQSTLDASDVYINNIDGDAIQAYNGAMLMLSSTTIRGTGKWGDALDIFRSTLIAHDIAASDIGGNIVLHGATATFDGLGISNVRGAPDIAVTGGTTTILHASLAGLGADETLGRDDNGIAAFQRASVSVSSSTIADYGSSGIVVFSGAYVVVASSTIAENHIGVSMSNGAMGEISGSAIMGNNIGINNINPAAEVNAAENYWGYPDGPAVSDIVGDVDVYPYYVENPIGADPLPALADEPMPI